MFERIKDAIKNLKPLDFQQPKIFDDTTFDFNPILTNKDLCIGLDKLRKDYHFSRGESEILFSSISRIKELHCENMCYHGWVYAGMSVPDPYFFDWVLVKISKYGRPMIAEYRNGRWFNDRDEDILEVYGSAVLKWRPMELYFKDGNV